MEEPICRRINKNAPNPPFLTVVTRTFQKPKCLAVNVMSLEKQLDQDYEQVFINDSIGRGLAWADQALNIYKDMNQGKYIMVLDDDDEIINSGFISTIKDIANRYTPDLIIWRGYFTEIQYTLPLINSNWGVVPIKTLIGSFNYCTTKEMFDKYIHVCASGHTGDFDFLETVFNNTAKNKIYWLKKILVRTQQKSFGKNIDIK